MSLFLPYNPTILAFNPKEEIKGWKHASLFYAPNFDRSLAYDLIWVEDEAEIELLANHRDLLEKARLIYTSTHLEEGAFSRLKSFLELSGFAFLTHWYWENGQGHALFLKQPFFDAYVRTLAYSPSGFSPQFPHPCRSNAT